MKNSAHSDVLIDGAARGARSGARRAGRGDQGALTDNRKKCYPGPGKLKRRVADGARVRLWKTSDT